jgi:hypothetical protein
LLSPVVEEFRTYHIMDVIKTAIADAIVLSREYYARILSTGTSTRPLLRVEMWSVLRRACSRRYVSRTAYSLVRGSK